MSPLLRPVQMLLLMFAGWVSRHQLDVIDYLQEENRVLKERVGGRRREVCHLEDGAVHRHLGLEARQRGIDVAAHARRIVRIVLAFRDTRERLDPLRLVRKVLCGQIQGNELASS